jgi:hypothetical protein
MSKRRLSAAELRRFFNEQPDHNPWRVLEDQRGVTLRSSNGECEDIRMSHDEAEDYGLTTQGRLTAGQLASKFRAKN